MITSSFTDFCRVYLNIRETNPHKMLPTLSAGAIEYANCGSTEG